MIKAAIEKIQSLVELSTEQAINIGGREYWRNSGHPIKPPTVSPVASVKTLDALRVDVGDGESEPYGEPYLFDVGEVFE